MSKIEKFKYKHNFYVKKANKRQFLDINLKGFLCSCNNNEKNCVRESYNLLNKYADILYPPQTNATNAEDINEDTDIADDLKNELLELKSDKNIRRFQVVESGAKNVIFIKTTLEDPLLLAEKIISDIAETKTRQTRVLLRLVPIDITCRAQVQDIERAFKQIATKHFVNGAKRFSIVYNHRNNNSLNRDDVIKAVANIVHEFGSDHKVDLKNAEISIVIEVIKGIALIGIVPNFIKYKKYNLHAVSEEDGEKPQNEENKELQTEVNST